MIRLALLSEGLTVDTAGDGLQGLDATQVASYDLIVLDLQMPNMDGREFFREFRARGGTTPVLLLSAYGALDARHELGAEAAISKPFDPTVLVRAVRLLLSTPAVCDPGTPD
jgi:DNA-binding response OmpR family regulator